MTQRGPNCNNLTLVLSRFRLNAPSNWLHKKNREIESPNPQDSEDKGRICDRVFNNRNDRDHHSADYRRGGIAP